eukprot:7529351-Alexandrium_andersonii.AAC.1
MEAPSHTCSCTNCRGLFPPIPGPGEDCLPLRGGIHRSLVQLVVAPRPDLSNQLSCRSCSNPRAWHASTSAHQ